MATSQQQLYDVLRERVSSDRYPSADLLDRLEAILYTPEQIIDYVNMLVGKIDESWYPSKQLLDRIQRMLTIVAQAQARQSAQNGQGGES